MEQIRIPETVYTRSGEVVDLPFEVRQAIEGEIRAQCQNAAIDPPTPVESIPAMHANATANGCNAHTEFLYFDPDCVPCDRVSLLLAMHELKAAREYLENKLAHFFPSVYNNTLGRGKETVREKGLRAQIHSLNAEAEISKAETEALRKETEALRTTIEVKDRKIEGLQKQLKEQWEE